MKNCNFKTLYALSLLLLTCFLLPLGCGSGGESSSSDGSTSAVASTLTPDLPSIQKNIFTPKCATVNCHSVMHPDTNNLVLTQSQSFANLVDALTFADVGTRRIGLVNPGDTSNSYLLWKLTDDPRINGNIMPAGGSPKLSNQEISAIKTWITNGAKKTPDE